MKKHDMCQSYGMPIEKDPKKGGTEKDGSTTTEYCSYCYQNGEFMSKDITTAKEMQKMCIKQMKKQGMNGIMAWLFTRAIPSLGRWKKKR